MHFKKGRIIMYKGSLRKCMQRFVNGDKNFYTDGLWKVAKGGYDLWFEVYYNNIPKIQCVNGELEVVNGEYFDKYKALQIIQQEYAGLTIKI